MKLANKTRRKRKRTPQQTPKNVTLTKPKRKKENIKNLTMKKSRTNATNPNPLVKRSYKLTSPRKKDKKKKEN